MQLSQTAPVYAGIQAQLSKCRLYAQRWLKAKLKPMCNADAVSAGRRSSCCLVALACGSSVHVTTAHARSLAKLQTRRSEPSATRSITCAALSSAARLPPRVNAGLHAALCQGASRHTGRTLVRANAPPPRRSLTPRCQNSRQLCLRRHRRLRLGARAAHYEVSTVRRPPTQRRHANRPRLTAAATNSSA